MLQKYFRMLITQESGCVSGADCFWNLNSSFKNQKSELFIWNLMVKYWSDRVKFWIYAAFKAFWISHQLLSLVVVYRSNRGMWVWVETEDALTVVPVPYFLGGLSLNLNHLIASRMANYNWPFGTLPFEFFWSNLDTKDLETYPRTYSSHFWNMSIFDNSRAIWVLFRKWVVSENQSFLDEGAIFTPLLV